MTETIAIEIEQETYDRIENLRLFWGLETIEDTLDKIVVKGMRQMYVYNIHNSPVEGGVRTLEKPG